MHLTLTMTPQFATVEGTLCRVWTGTSGEGVPLVALIPLIMVRTDHDTTAFDRALMVHASVDLEGDFDGLDPRPLI